MQVQQNALETPMQFFAALARENRHYDFLVNPVSFVPKDPKTLWVQGQQFRCVHYEEKQVNRFDNLSNPERAPLFTYYCSSGELQRQLELDFENTYQKAPFDPSCIQQDAKEEVEENQKKFEVDPEDLHVDHAVIFASKQVAAEQEVEDRVYFVK